jgi:hypothetical protein
MIKNKICKLSTGKDTDRGEIMWFVFGDEETLTSYWVFCHNSEGSLIVGVNQSVFLMEAAKGTVLLHLTDDIVHHLLQVVLDLGEKKAINR